jgi:hypothetical protein
LSFDSFQTSGNSPGRARRIALPGFVGSAVSRRVIYRTKTSGLKLAAMLEDQSQLQPETSQGRTPSMDIKGKPLAGYVEAV